MTQVTSGAEDCQDAGLSSARRTTCEKCGKKLRSDNRSGFCYRCKSYGQLTPYSRHMDNERSRRVSGAFRVKIAAIKVERGCVDCGYNRYPEALDFDHMPGEVKVKAVTLMWGHSWEKVLAEIAKCEIVCSNCHRHRTKLRTDAAKALRAQARAASGIPAPTRPLVAACGTESGYNRHRERGEAACAECLAAHSAGTARRSRAARAAARTGTTTAVGNQVAVGC